MRTGKPRICRSRSSRMLNRPTWMRGERSGSSLIAKMPRLVRGTMPKWMTSGSAKVSLRVVVELRPGEHGHLGVEQGGERAQDAGLGLAAQAEQDEVVAGEQGVDHRRDDRAVVADDAGEQRSAASQALAQVVAQLLLDRAGLVAARLERAEGLDSR